MFEQVVMPIRDRLAAAGVRRLGVFGSVARGDADASSDVDVLISFDPSKRTFDNFMAASDALESVFKRKVDLVTESSLSPYIGPKILREVHYVDLTR